eukprot:TRINITY_DN604_c0_g1_i2.p2 TRINITY_DN604_c0_g1~~TRINITY_DN604_c0_g1_i2.p2  ORF type:complete len:96 (-),score=1.29 TRINITY_DN604_c0_g1_i2:732-1019(-)
MMGSAGDSLMKRLNIQFPAIEPILPAIVKMPKDVERRCVGKSSVETTSRAFHPPVAIPKKAHENIVTCHVSFTRGIKKLTIEEAPMQKIRVLLRS